MKLKSEFIELDLEIIPTDWLAYYL